MPTKRELEGDVAFLRGELTHANEEAEKWRKAYFAQRDKIAKDFTGFRVWRATASPGSPFCIYPERGENKEQGTFGVELYVEEGRIIGVVVNHTNDGDITGAGLVPYDR